MSQNAQDCIIRVWTELVDSDRASKAVVGTGFLVKGVDGQVYAITCAHVVNAALGLDHQQSDKPENATIRADMPGRGLISLTLLAWFPPTDISAAQDHDGVADIAILRPVAEGLNLPESLPPLRVEPPRQVVPLNANVPFHTFGYMVSQNGLAADGQLKATDSRDWFVAYGRDGVQPFIQEGLSGAPAFSSDGRQILGMVVQRLALEFRQGFVIPAHALAKAWPLLTIPYPGLSAFDRRNAHLFFGRGRAPDKGTTPPGKIKEILDRLAKQRLMAIVGTSGSGKSSLVKAGIAEDYRRRGWALFTFRPSDAEKQDIAGQIDQKLMEMGQREDANSGTLFIIDQFEEFFPGQEIQGHIGTGQPDHAHHLTAQRTKVLSLLLSAVTRPDVHCLLTARLDLLETMVTADETVARLFTDPYPSFMLTAMSVPEVREAIEGPAQLFGVETDSYFAGTLAVEATRGAGRLPLLQEALRQCWRRLERVGTQWRLRQPPDLADGDPARLLEDALRRRGDDAVKQLRRLNYDALDIDRALLSLVRLVDDRPLRRRLPLSELTSDRDRRLLEDLARERIAVVEGEGSARTVELLHESLMSGWQKLADLIAQHRHFLSWRDRFDREFAAWQQGGREGRDLLRRHDLEQAREWQANKAGIYIPPTPDQEAYIQISQEQVEQQDQRIAAELREKEAQNRRLLEQQRMLEDQNNILVVQQQKVEEQNNVLTEQQQRLKQQNIRTKRWLGIAMMLLAIAIAASITGYWLFQEAQRQESRVLAAFSRQESDRGDNITAMLLAFEALPDSSLALNRPLVPEAEAALRQAWLRNRVIARVPIEANKVRKLVISDDGSKVVFETNNEKFFVFDGKSKKLEELNVSIFGSFASLDGVSGNGGAIYISNKCGFLACDILTVIRFDNGRQIQNDIDVSSIDTGGFPLFYKFNNNGNGLIAHDLTHAYLFSIDQFSQKIDLSVSGTYVSEVVFSPNDKEVVATYDDGSMWLWWAKEGMGRLTLKEPSNDPVESLEFSRDAKLLFYTLKSGDLKVFDLSKRKTIEVDFHIIGRERLDLVKTTTSNDNRFLVALSKDGTAWRWDISSLEEANIKSSLNGEELKSHGKGVFDIKISSLGHYISSLSRDGKIRIGELFDSNGAASSDKYVINLSDQIERLRERFDLYDETLISDFFSSNFDFFVTANSDNDIEIWDLRPGMPSTSTASGKADIIWHNGNVLDAEFSHSDNLVATASQDYTAKVIDISDEYPNLIAVLPHGEPVDYIQFVEGGIITAPSNYRNAANYRMAKVWNYLSNPPVQNSLQGNLADIEPMDVSRDGRFAVTATDEGIMQIWTLADKDHKPLSVTAHNGRVAAARFSKSGRWIVTASADGTAKIWDTKNVAEAYSVLEHYARVTDVSLSPDERWVVTGSDDSQVRIWRVEKAPQQPIVLEGHKDVIINVRFNSDGNSIISASLDGTARIWNLANSATTSLILEGHWRNLTSASFSPDGKHIITSSYDDTARIWEHPELTELISKIRRSLPRCLSSAQRERFGLKVASLGADRNTVPMPDAQGRCPR